MHGELVDWASYRSAEGHGLDNHESEGLLFEQHVGGRERCKRGPTRFRFSSAVALDKTCRERGGAWQCAELCSMGGIQKHRSMGFD